MNNEIKILFVILLAFTTFSPSAPAQHLPSKLDITQTFNHSTNELFETVISGATVTLFGTNRYPQISFQIKIGDAPFSCKLRYGFNTKDISSLTMYSNFVQNETLIHFEKFTIYGDGFLEEEQCSEQIYDVSWIISLRNVSVQVEEKSPPIISFIDNTDWATDVHLNLKYDLKLEEALIIPTTSQLKFAIIPLIHDNLIEHGTKIVDALRYNTYTIFTQNHPDFLQYRSFYYYSIPIAPYMCFSLKNINIKGLTNFLSLNKTNERYDIFRTTLIIVNVSGNMILDYQTENQKPLKLNFLSDQVIITTNRNNIQVEAKNYTVVRTATNTSLTDHQMAIIMQRIESSLASSLMPFKTIMRNNNQNILYDMERSLRKMTTELVQKSDWKTLKQMLNLWVPFNDDQINAVNVISKTGSRFIQTKSHDYHLSFPNITVKLISDTAYPKQIQCEFPNNLKMVHEISATPIRRVRFNNREGNGIDINFHANFTSINFLHIKPDNFGGNKGCEFQVTNDEGINVELTPMENTTENEQKQLKKKLHQALISIKEKHIFQNIKTWACLPTYDICSQTRKIVDEFVSNFTAKLLNKCFPRWRNKS